MDFEKKLKQQFLFWVIRRVHVIQVEAQALVECQQSYHLVPAWDSAEDAVILSPAFGAVAEAHLLVCSTLRLSVGLSMFMSVQLL